jgi:hypothetical protein
MTNCTRDDHRPNVIQAGHHNWLAKPSVGTVSLALEVSRMLGTAAPCILCLTVVCLASVSRTAASVVAAPPPLPSPQQCQTAVDGYFQEHEHTLGNLQDRQQMLFFMHVPRTGKIGHCSIGCECIHMYSPPAHMHPPRCSWQGLPHLLPQSGLSAFHALRPVLRHPAAQS